MSLSPSSLSQLLLDEQWYLYQNPRTGTVSAAPLSLRQLIKLLCPPRQGLSPILPGNTQCLPMEVTKASADQDGINKKTTTSQDDDSTVATQLLQESSVTTTTTYGEWKPATDIDILRQASCQEWYWTISGSKDSPCGPGSCRMLLEKMMEQQHENPMTSSPILVFAKDQTSEWTDISQLPSLQVVLQALLEETKATSEFAPNQQSTELQHPPPSSHEQNSQEVQDELDAFLSSTADGIKSSDKIHTEDINAEDDENDANAYESDGGTQYIQDPVSGNWIHEALAPPEARARLKRKEPPTSAYDQNDSTTDLKTKKKKKKKAAFSKRNAKNWIYISGLPTEQDITSEDIQRYFAKAGLLDLDPETLQPKIKLYRDHDTGRLKGDASVCYARPESVDLALQVLDDSLWDANHRIKVERAHFEAKEEKNDNHGDTISGKDTSTNSNGNNNHKVATTVVHKTRNVSQAQRKVARLALLQAQDDGFGERLAGGRKGLRIIVINHLMEGIPENTLEEILHETLEQYGQVEKITVITKTQVVIVKYVEPLAASEALEALHGSVNPRTKEKIEAIYWDGVTDYTNARVEEEKERQEEEKRHEEFGNWLESQEDLPPELRLQVAKEL